MSSQTTEVLRAKAGDLYHRPDPDDPERPACGLNGGFLRGSEASVSRTHRPCAVCFPSSSSSSGAGYSRGSPSSCPLCDTSLGGNKTLSDHLTECPRRGMVP